MLPCMVPPIHNPSNLCLGDYVPDLGRPLADGPPAVEDRLGGHRPFDVGGFIYLAGVATILPFALYSASLRHLEVSRTSLTSMLEPVVAASVAWLWHG
jgi:drug/metabolite transporter (DMT)-like permease